MSESTQTLRAALEQVLAGKHLSVDAAQDVLRALTDEAVAPVLSAALLTALRAKGETAEEIRGFAMAMRDLARRPAIADTQGAIDIVGTGGDGSGSVNISTGCALLTAACGVPVIKHGNRSVSSKSGSADVLEVLGLPMPLDEKGAAQALTQSGFTFLFAPFYHPAMKAVAPVRQGMGIRTVFNILGPLTNPAAPPYMLIGAFSLPMAELMANALAGLPIERAFVIHGEPGWDEATPVGVYDLFDVRPGSVVHERRDPLDEKFARCTPADLAGGDAAFNAGELKRVLHGEDQSAHYDALVLGASLALEVTGTAASRRAAIATAREAINAGRGRKVLEALAQQSNAS
ncbi:MAG: anthranilate phosphoribosyltransferase [Gammaproteobacteria bacterium]